MSDDNFTDFSEEEIKLGGTIFSMVNLKYFFFGMLILSFLVMSFGRQTGTRRIRLINRKRKFIQEWSREKGEKIKALSKKSVDIKDFTKYKPSDIENITALNTLINSYISKMYEEIVSTFPVGKIKKSETADVEIKSSNDEREERKEGISQVKTSSTGIVPAPVLKENTRKRDKSTNDNSESSQLSGE